MLTKVRLTARLTALVLGAVFFSVLPVRAADSTLTDFTERVNELVYQLSRSVVTVEAYSPRQRPSNNADGSPDAVYSLVSSGVICDSSNHILVVAQSVANRELILIRNGDKLEPADVVGIDYRSGLAVLEADGPVGPPADFAQSFACAGQMIVAVGNSYGMPATPSIGFCAGLRNDGQMQFSAQVTSGSIGGALFDLSGNLVGLITGGIGSSECSDVGLAVPGYRLPDIVTHLILHGTRNAGFLGVTATNMQISPPVEIHPPAQLATSRPVGKMLVDRGVMITSVVPSSPAARGGLLPGDLVFSIDDQQLVSASQLVSRVMDMPPGKTVPIGLLRDKQQLFISVEIGQKQLDQASGEISTESSNYSADNDEALWRQISRMQEELDVLRDRVNRPKK